MPKQEQPKPQGGPYEGFMSFEQYFEREHETPYVFHVEGGEKKITYFGDGKKGGGHSFDPDDPQFAEVEKLFHTTKPDLVIVEGIGSRIHEADAREKVLGYKRAELTKKAGQAGFVAHIAFENNVEVDSPEPEEKDLVHHLQSLGFEREEIFVHNMYTIISQYHSLVDKPDFKTYLQRSIDLFEKNSTWEGFDYSIENLEEIAKKIWPDDYHFDSPSQVRDDPTPRSIAGDHQTVVNRIAMESSYYRDAYMIRRIRKYLETKKNILIVFGASHAVMQEPAIRKLMEAQQ